MTEWVEEDLSGDPILVVGWRTAKTGLVGRSVELHQDVFGELRAACEPALASISRCQPKQYEPFAATEPGEEYFAYELPASDQPQPDLAALLQSADLLEPISAQALRSTKFLFYAIVWRRAEGGRLAFVTKADPRRALMAGTRYFRYGDDLKSVMQPDLVLNDGASLVIRPSDVAVLSAPAFKDLFSDIQVVFSSVASNVAGIGSAIGPSLTMSQTSSDALIAVGRKKLSVARRLAMLSDRLAAIQRDASRLRSYIRRFGMKPADFVTTKGELVFGEDNAERFLDFAEGRIYQDELGEQHRRADRFSSLRQVADRPASIPRAPDKT